MRFPKILAIAGGCAVLVSAATAQKTDSIIEVLQSVKLASSECIGGENVPCRVMLDRVVASFAVSVSLASNNPQKASVPTATIVPVGSRIKWFNVRTQTVLTDTLVTIEGSLNGIKTDNLLIHPGGLTLLLTPIAMDSLGVLEGAVFLSGARSTDAFIEMRSSNTSAAVVPSPVTVSAGTVTKTFPIVAGAVFADTPVTIRAREGNSIRVSTTVVRAFVNL